MNTRPTTNDSATVDQPDLVDRFECRVLWLDASPLAPGRLYRIELDVHASDAIVAELRSCDESCAGTRHPAAALAQNETGCLVLSLREPVLFDPKAVDQAQRSFRLIDKVSSATVGTGAICHALRRARDVPWQPISVSPQSRARQKAQTPQCIWFTGLSGSGKSTIANLLDLRLNAEGRHTYLLDGDNIRHGLNRDLGFSEVDRIENIRRIAEVARLMVDAGLIVLVSFISPFRNERRMARDLFPKGAFRVVFIDTPIEECERRDPKGLYRLARKGELTNFTGIDSPYEPPRNADVRISTVGVSAEHCVQQVSRALDLTFGDPSGK